jgi:SAM-dependent methyltransferase
MDDLSKEYVVSFFSRTLHMYGDSPEAVKWSPRGQKLRFECLLEIDHDISGKKILDYGCGKGDFYQFLRDKNIPVDYTGFDINENLISLAAGKFPECRFSVFDVEKDSLNEDFDYIFLCGVFNLKLEGLVETIENVLARLFKHCRIALAFNALSSHEPHKVSELHYLSPEHMLEFAAQNLSPFVSLVHDRVPYDFSLFVRKKSNKITL